jgi:K+-sensing histidine kinase KdpD
VNVNNQNKIQDIIKQTIDINRLIDSLLILAKIEDRYNLEFKKERIDELLFTVIEEIKLEFLDCRIEFEIEENPEIYDSLEILMNQSIFKIALINLFLFFINFVNTK